MKAYTDIEQSKNLAEILPLERADMCYRKGEFTDKYLPDLKCYKYARELYADYIKIIPCWSLAALLDIYPIVVGIDMEMYCCWINCENLHSRHYYNPVDPCYEMILKLHELNIL